MITDLNLPAWTRRRLLAAGAVAPVVGFATGCEAQTLVAARDGDVRAGLQALIDRGDVTIAAGPGPYRLSGSIHIPAGRRVRFEAGTRFRYTGPVGAPGDAVGVFLIEGDDVTVGTISGEMSVDCAPESPFVWAVLGSGVSRLTVSGVRGIGCAHIRLTATTAAYAAISTDKARRQVCRDIAIIGGGATFREPPQAGEGACYVSYTIGWSLRDASYQRVGHGVQWWGGNAAPGVADGAVANERKCADFVIANVSVTDATFAAIWGSMARNGRIEDCRVERCGDVGFDAEGCNDVTFARCRSRDATNGCFSTFFLCSNIVFADCGGFVTDHRKPLFRLYNSSQSSGDTGLVAIRGGRFECADRAGAGSIDTASGPTGRLEISGATLVNVRIDTAHFNMHETRIAGNRLSFPYGAPAGAAIRAGAAKAMGKAGTTVVENNRIDVTGARVSPASAIHLVEDDFNASADDIVRGNTVSAGFTHAITVENASANVGIQPSFRIEGNSIEAAGTAIRVATRDGSQSPAISLSHNHRADGRPISTVGR